MGRQMLNDNDIEKVVGGSIMFNDDCTTCGRNCTDQYKVLDLNAVIAYVNANKKNMSEKQMLNNMVAQGLLASL